MFTIEYGHFPRGLFINPFDGIARNEMDVFRCCENSSVTVTVTVMVFILATHPEEIWCAKLRAAGLAEVLGERGSWSRY
jgi:hypothetical protein